MKIPTELNVLIDIGAVWPAVKIIGKEVLLII